MSSLKNKTARIMPCGFEVYFLLNILFKITVIIMIIPITINIAIIPESMYLRLSIKAIGLKALKILLAGIKLLNIFLPPYFIKKLRIRPPAITEAI